MVLLGGVHSLAGAPLGAAVYKILDTVSTQHTVYWQAILGGILVVLVMVFPRGLVGYVRARRARQGIDRG
jgi:branched-chain amino acid transport system permease protein